MTDRRCALVPGASGGIGSVVAEVLAERGYDLWLGARSRSPAFEAKVEHLRSHGCRVLVAPLEATDASNIRDWVRAAETELGSVDILANCIGWHGETLSFTPFAEQAQAHWQRVLAIELVATMQLIQCVIPAMTARGFGRIITLGSESAKIGEGGIAANAAARGGCVAFSKSIAREVGRHGITVNVVCPGPTDTPLMGQMDDPATQRIVAKLGSLTALKRIGTAREVAQVVAFLASADASYVTGQAISVSGGLTMC